MAFSMGQGSGGLFSRKARGARKGETISPLASLAPLREHCDPAPTFPLTGLWA